MDRSTIDHALGDRRLLAHPFYRRWEEGALRDGELADYAGQYRHVERQLPLTLRELLDGLNAGPVRQAIESNLDDELSRPVAHVELFETFADGVGATDDPATAATAALVQLYATAPRRGASFAVGVLAAYEVQAAAIARTKAQGLRDRYGLCDVAISFWDVHAELEDEHASWSLDAAGALDARAVLEGVAASRDAWWAFLDDRELAAAH